MLDTRLLRKVEEVSYLTLENKGNDRIVSIWLDDKFHKMCFLEKNCKKEILLGTIEADVTIVVKDEER